MFENVISDVVSAIDAGEDFPRDSADNVIISDILQRVAAEAPVQCPEIPKFKHLVTAEHAFCIRNVVILAQKTEQHGI